MQGSDMRCSVHAGDRDRRSDSSDTGVVLAHWGSACINFKLKTTLKINIETRRSTTPGKRVILVQGPC